MARQPAPPVLNLPQAIVEFVQLIRDPSWLPQFVGAAESVADANKLTTEEAQHLKDALAIMEDASHVKEKHTSENNRLTSLESRLALREEQVANREKQCDERNTVIADKEKQLSDLARSLAAQRRRVNQQAAQQELVAEAQEKEAARLKNWVGELADQEKAWDEARGKVARKKSA